MQTGWLCPGAIARFTGDQRLSSTKCKNSEPYVMSCMYFVSYGIIPYMKIVTYSSDDERQVFRLATE